MSEAVADRPSRRAEQSSVRTTAQALAAVVVTIVVLVAALVGAAFLGVSLLGSGGDSSGAEEPPSLYIPPTPSPTGRPDGRVKGPADPSTGQPLEPARTHSGRGGRGEGGNTGGSGGRRGAFTLEASPRSADAYESVTLSGSCSAPSGTTLDVQRDEGGWTSFSGVTATCDGGRYQTYIETGVAGSQRFRMLDSDSGTSSNVVIIEIH